MSYILYECASGYGLFERLESADIELKEVRDSCTDLAKFSKQVKLKAFIPFISAEMALDNINSVSEGDLNDYLKNFLEQNLPKTKSVKKCKFAIGVSDPRMGTCIQDELQFKCQSGEVVNEMLRGIRNHFTHFIKALRPGDLEKAQLGLGHSYSRAKVKFNVHRVDNMIIQAIALLDQLDKDLNTFAMRVREWYGWHFPELARITSDNIVIARLAKLIQNRNTLNEAMLPQIEEITNDSTMAREILEASKASMGTDISLIDMINIKTFAERVVSLNDYRMQLHEYLKSKMHQCAPNLSALIGEMVGARLISHAGSLTNLAKYPASTVQILGAEKALFRALKTKGNTPKYGLIFHSSFIGRAAQKNKGRISRYLANKCSIASRVDSFSELPNSIYGEKLKAQVEERLNFYETGATPRKNAEVMAEAAAELKAQNPDAFDESDAKATKQKSKKDKKSKKSKDKKRKREEAADETEEPVKSKKSKSKKKDKSDKKSKKKSKK